MSLKFYVISFLNFSVFICQEYIISPVCFFAKTRSNYKHSSLLAVVDILEVFEKGRGGEGGRLAGREVIENWK